MLQAKELNEEEVLQRLRNLPSTKRQEILDFLEFLESRVELRQSLEFDEWAVNLAKEKGYAHLTEDDVASIVRDLRSGR